jgi:hypothetical protein
MQADDDNKVHPHTKPSLSPDVLTRSSPHPSAPVCLAVLHRHSHLRARLCTIATPICASRARLRSQSGVSGKSGQSAQSAQSGKSGASGKSAQSAQSAQSGTSPRLTHCTHLHVLHVLQLLHLHGMRCSVHTHGATLCVTQARRRSQPSPVTRPSGAHRARTVHLFCLHCSSSH